MPEYEIHVGSIAVRVLRRRPQAGVTRQPDTLRLGKDLAHSRGLRGLSEQELRRLGEAFNVRLLEQFKQWGE